MLHHFSIRPELLKHALAYSILAAGLSLITLAFLAVWPNRIAQRYLIVILCAFYFGWGVISHVKTSHITWRVILEYGGMSVLAGALLLLITV